MNIDANKLEELITETKVLLRTGVTSGVCIGLGRQQILVELGLWPEENEMS